MMSVGKHGREWRQCKNWSFKVVTKLVEVNLVDQVENPSRNIIKKFLRTYYQEFF